VRPDRVGNLDLELRELLVDVPAARHEPALMTVLRQRAEAVVFEFEQPVGMVEGGGDANQWHWPKLDIDPAEELLERLTNDQPF
jgi:hypothetical protein